jgi:hypothetical protein
VSYIRDRITARHYATPDTYDVMVYTEGGHYYAKDQRGNLICVDSPTACIQEGIDNSSGIVFIRPGFYDVTSTIYLPSDINLIGSGMNKTIIRQASGFSGAVFKWKNPSAQNSKYMIANMWIYGSNPVTGANALVDLSQSNISALGLLYNVSVECNPTNTVCIDLSGNEDTAVIASAFSINTSNARPSVKWFTPYGNITSIFNKYFGGGYFQTQVANFIGDTFGPKQGLSLTDVPNYPAVYKLVGCYINGDTSFSGIFTFPSNGYGSIIVDLDSLFVPGASVPFVSNPTSNPITVYLHIKNSAIVPSAAGNLFGPNITGYYALYGYIRMPNITTNGTAISGQYSLI